MKCYIKLLVLLIILLPLLYGCDNSSQPAPKNNPPRPVVLVEVKQFSTGERVYSGVVQTEKEIIRSFRVPGQILKRHVIPGQEVTKGEVLFELDDADFLLEVQRAEAELEASKVSLDIAKLNVEREQSLVSKGLSNQQRLDLLILSEKEALARQRNAISVLDLAKNRLAYTELKSPKSGVVTFVHAEAGEVIVPGSPVVTVAETDAWEVEVALPSKQNAPQFARAIFENGKQASLSLREIAGAANSSSRTWNARYKIEDDIANTLFGSVAKVFASKDANASSAKIVPLSSVSQSDDSPYVLVAENGIAVKRFVSVIDSLGEQILVTGEIQSGEKIISAGLHTLNEGDKIVEVKI